MDAHAAGTVLDPSWFPFRFDRKRDEFHFARVTPDLHQAVTFLSDLRPSGADLRVIPRSAVPPGGADECPLHFILHSGLGGSTLLARALWQPGVVTTFKEPPILTDIIGYALSAGAQQTAELTNLVASLLARPFHSGEAVIIKVNSVGNGIAGSMALTRPRSRILCLASPLEEMLASLARRGLEGRLGGRKLFIGLRNSRLAELGFDESQLFQQSSLQLAALAWLAIHRVMRETADQLGQRIAGSIASHDLLDRPVEALSAIAEHLNLNLAVDQRMKSGIFSRHAKTGEPFDAGMRARVVADALAVHGEEIRLVADWARKVAEANAIAWDLPCPILPKGA